MKSLTTVLTLLSGLTAAGIYGAANYENADDPTKAVAIYTPEGRADNVFSALLREVRLRKEQDVETITDDTGVFGELSDAEREAAAIRWHTRLQEARRANRLDDAKPQPRATPNRSRRADRPRPTTNMRGYSKRKSADDNRSIFARSRAFKRNGSAYPLTRTNRALGNPYSYRYTSRRQLRSNRNTR